MNGKPRFGARTSRWTARAVPFALLAVMAVAVPACGAQRGDEAGEQPPAKFLGNVWSPRQIEDFGAHWDQVTPENAGKWGPMAPRRGETNWELLDAAYAHAKERGIPFRFHVLVWGNQQPAWMADLPPEEQLAEIEARFAAIAARYPEMDYVEVVNEPLHDPPRRQNPNDVSSGDYFDALGGEGETGWDWVLNAFRMARRHFPASTRLMLNEYSVTNSRESAERYLALVRLLQEEGLIDVIGVQGHAFATTVPASVTRENLDLLASTGLPIMVTEFDIDGPTDEIQLAEYQRIFPVFWEHPAVIGVTLWGWRPGLWRTRQGANLVREDGSYRPALDWLLTYTGRERN